jgi:predicted nucleic acid-binding protein
MTWNRPMPAVISNTSPLLYLYRIGLLEWLPTLCSDIWIPHAVVRELQEGQQKGYDVPMPGAYTWLQVVEPQAVPSEWLALDLGAGELAVLALALEHLQRVVLLDDSRARRIAQAASLTV